MWSSATRNASRSRSLFSRNVRFSRSHRSSLALIPLRAGIAPQAFGLLVLASADQQRFASDMGTDFLERIGEITSAALSRLRPE